MITDILGAHDALHTVYMGSSVIIIISEKITIRDLG